MKIPPKSKKAIPPPGPVAALISKLLKSSDEQLTTTLKEIDSWKWPRTDLNAWINVLNRFDDVMDAAIREYNIDKLQLVPFSENTKELLSEILRFERLLLEYSTNRKTFNSYDRLNNLLSASDLDIVILALNVLLRPSQQYSAQPSVSHALSISTTRLQSLAKRWPYLREHGIGLLELATDQSDDVDSVPPEAKEVNFTFYRLDPVPTPDKKTENVAETPTSSPRKPTVSAPALSSNAVQIRLDEQTMVSQPVMNVLSDAIQTYAIPEAETFELLCRIRASASLAPGKKTEREKLLIIRLLAIAIYGHTHPESQATSALFLYEPDLIAHVAELLQTDKGVPISVQTAAIAALDALARYKTKAQEVLTAVNAGVNHGILLALVRKMVVEVADPESQLPHSFIEALLSFITYLASHGSGGNMVVGAGLIPLLVQIIENKNPSRLAVISKAMQLVDNVIYSFTNAFSLFCASRGVEVLVERIEYEIDYDIKEYSISFEPCALSGIGELPTKRIAVLKHMLRSMHRMMQSSGTAEGLRSLIDMSLLKSINKVVQYRGLFGPSIFPLAINIMSTFVHNEPTSLAIIQEAGLPTMFYQALENGIEPAIEVIQAIPNAIGALCLNEVGQAQLSNRPSIIPTIISIFTSERHLKVLLDKENAVIIGTAVDELIRHHPTLKQAVFEALKSTLSHLENIGMTYSTPKDLKQWYQLVPVSQERTNDDVAMQDAMSSSDAVDTTAVVVDETSSQNGEESEDAEEKPHDNIIVSYIDVLGRFLEGFFQHPLHCKDFVLDTDGLQQIGRLTALPCLPYDFANSVASDSMVQVLRTMAEVATSDTLFHLIDMVKRSLADTKFFWESMDGDSKLLSFVDPSEEDEETINQQFRNLVTLHIRITLLSDVLATAGQSQGRAAAAGFWQTLMNSIPRQVLADLGALHRASLWENIILQPGLTSKGIELPSSTPPPAEEGSSGVTTITAPVTDGTLAGVTTDVNAGTVTTNAKAGQATKHQSPRAWNASALKHITHGLPNALAPFFQVVVKMFHARRNADSVQKEQIIGSSKVIADIMLKHLGLRDHEDKPSLYCFYSLLLELFVLLLTDDRTSTNTLHTVQLVALYRIGGFDAIFDICEAVVTDIDELVKIPDDARTEHQRKHLLHAYGTIKLILHLLHPIISSKPLFESNQTLLIVTRDKKDTDPDYFEPHNFLVRLRYAAIPIVRRLWESPWLAQAPVGVGKYVVRSMLEIANGENEESKGDDGEAGNMPPAVPRSSSPTETQIRMLTDMGFPRSAAERALIRTNNDVNTATEYLLSRPFPFPPDPPEADPASPLVDTQEPPLEEPSDDSTPNTPEPSSPKVPMAEGGSSMTDTLPGKTSDEWRRLLNEAREPLRENISKRALSLIDEHLSLLFDLHVVFTKRSSHQGQAIRNLIDDVSSFSAYAYDVQEQPLANRCRLLALVLCERPEALEADLRNTLMDRLLALLLSTRDPEHPPKWLAAHLLVTEALFTLADEPLAISAPKESEIPIAGPISVGPSRPEARTMVFDFCLQLLTNDDLPADELLSVLRLFVLLTRDRQMAAQFVSRNGLSLLFQRLRKSAVTGASSYIASILRHLVEDVATIQNIMQQTIKRYFTQPRSRLVDLAAYVRNCSAIALRDTNIFIDVTKSMCQVEAPYSPSPHIKLQPNVQTNDKAVATIEAAGDMQVDTAQSVSSNVPHKAAEGVIHQLISELMSSTKAINEGETATGTSNSTSTEQDTIAREPQNATDNTEIPIQTASGAVDDSDKQQYLCFVMQCLTELLFSYDSCKVAFLSYSSKKRPQQAQTKDTKFRNTTLQFLLSELITYSTINPASDPKYRSRTTLCSWAMNVVGALCVDTSTTHETKEVSPDLILVRKFVLETVSRAIKEVSCTTEGAEARYGRLLALGDLCHRLLTVRVNVSSRKQQQDEVPTHLAKIMLEKNFVSTFTTALSEVDLNYPNVRNLVASILRPLEYLSKIAIKMSKASGKNKEDSTQVEANSSASEEEDEVMDDAEARDETPDLYRNSALGMYGGEMDDRQYSDDEDMDDEEDDQDVEMEYGEATGSEETSESESEGDEDVLEAETRASGNDWGEGDEDEEDLVEDRDDDDGDDDDDDDDDEPGHGADEDQDNEDDEGEEEEDAAGIMWEDVQQPETLGMLLENADDEQGLGVPIQINHEVDEPDLGSDEDELMLDHGHFNNDGLIDLGNAVITHGPGLFIQRRHRSNDQHPFGRPRNAPSAPEAITHPLLLDASAQNRSNAPSFSRSVRGGQRFLANVPPPGFLEALDEVLGEASLQAINQINHIIHHGGGGIGGIGGMLHIQVPVGAMFPQTRRLLTGTSRAERTVRTTPHRQGREFEPLLTLQRWAEEMKIVHGDFVNERAGKLTNHLLVAMFPAALEALKHAKLKAEEEAKHKAEEEEKEKQKVEEEEAKKKADQSERKAEEAISDSTGEPTTTIEGSSSAPIGSVPEPLPTAINEQEGVPSGPQDSAMEETVTAQISDSEMADATEATPSDPPQVGAESPIGSPPPAPAQSSSAAADRERITVMIHGSAVDITDTGIDPTFLEALPDDMREEVLNQHVRDQQASRVERPPDSQISSEFLDALPPDIRAEIIQQEAMERTRRRTDETTARPPVREAAEIDAASFIASLDPSLRQAVLLDQDDTFLRTLPSHMIAEAGVYRDELQARRTHTSRNPIRPIPTVPSVKKYALQHDAILLLDRSGLAVLLRLLFYPQVLKKSLLFKVLVNLCENMKTRMELFNLLLSILQDGTGDLSLVDKSFAQMTVRGRDSKPQIPKALKQRSDYVSPLGFPMSQMETAPDLIAQRSLEALTFIVNANESSSFFFLTEHDIPAGLRKPGGKKGKGKEKQVPQTHYPLVLLLNLLDRQSLLRTPAILESVVGLLATISRPLTSLKEQSKPTMDPLAVEANETDNNASLLPPVSQQDVPESNPIERLPQTETAVPRPEPQPATESKVPGESEDKNPLPHPPHVPHSALRLIVNILTVGECSSRTFQQSLTLIQNLSFIPDARDVIALELKTKAQDSGQTLYSDLDELAMALQEGRSQTITSSVTAKFSPASSTQAKLLRVLKTIDYMYTPKPVSTSSTAETASKEDVEKVQAIYESFRFTPLWRRLGDCLSCIGENPETEHIATVLLPLIESLMVVCKFVGSKGPLSRAMRVAASPRSPITPRESMEELFISFTDAHRKVLNLMVRNNPSLMSGSFSLLVNNSRVLDFDNKRNYFNQQLHRRPHIREHHGTLQLNVRRARVFEDSFLYLQRKTGEQIKYGKLSVRFYDEEGVDAGGLTREWFQILARQMFNPNYALFQPCAADKLTYQPNKASWVNPEHLSFFKFVGRVIGKAIYDGRLLDAYFARSLYRQILGKPVDYKDVEWVDPEYYNSLCWILENDPTVLELTFSIEADEFGVNKIVAMKEGGEHIQVTQENKREYVQLSAQYRLYSSIKDQIESLLSGFYEIIPKDLITIFNEQELELLISGTPDIDVDEWRAATEYNSYTASDPNIVWWWRALKSFNREERAKVLSFATGTSRVPLNGFLDLQGVQGVQKFSIHRAYGEPDRLPQAHTCFNQIDLPQYTSYDMLRQQLLLAINEGGEGFGFS